MSITFCSHFCHHGSVIKHYVTKNTLTWCHFCSLVCFVTLTCICTIMSDKFSFFILALENNVMLTSKCCVKIFSLIFIVKCTTFLTSKTCVSKLFLTWNSKDILQFFSNNLLTTILQNDLLTEAFGSSKKKRAMASRLRNKIDNTGLDDTVTEVVQALANEPMDKTGLNLDFPD